VSASAPRTPSSTDFAAPPVGSHPPGPLSAASAPLPTPSPVVLDVRDLVTYFYTYDGVVRALEGVSFKLRRGETLGMVGETGCGKSVSMFSITRLIPDPPGRVVSGKILFRGADLLWGLKDEARFYPIKNSNRVKVKRSFRRVKAGLARVGSVRGAGIAMIFQEPSQAMNPIFPISDQVAETILEHRGVEVVEGLLAAGPDGPVLRGPIAAMTAAVRSGDAAAAEKAAAALGSLTGDPDFPSRALALAQSAGPSGARTVEAKLTEESRRLHAERFEAAQEKLVRATEEHDDAGMRSAAKAIGEAVHLSSFGTQAFYLARQARLSSSEDVASRLGKDLEKARRRLRLTGSQRGYLTSERQLSLIRREMRAAYLSEMRRGQPERVRRGRLAALRLRTRLRALPNRMWGVRRKASAPLREELFWRVVAALEGVQIANPVQVARGYPHELSGGMLQRVMIAMALAGDPEILMADEPTTALDVTIQAQILELMKEMRTRIGTAILLVTHDLAVIAEVADRVAVMYAGQIVEMAPVRELFVRPLHPYTQGLIASIPRFDQPTKDLASIAGSVPNLIYPPTGCRFHPRCPYAMPVCQERRPPMSVEGEGHHVACFLYNGPPAVE
jgi:oligopeptide/dipeptide ABC transporter ATP-binding protein